MDMKTAVIYRLEELIRQKDITVNEAAIRSGVPPSVLRLKCGIELNVSRAKKEEFTEALFEYLRERNG